MMSVQSDYMEAGTSLTYDSLWRVEDSGYHTSFTPGSIAECSDIANENFDPTELHGTYQDSDYHESPSYGKVSDSLKYKSKRKYYTRKCFSSSKYECHSESGLKRGKKRPFQDTYNDINTQKPTLPTPTSDIAGRIQSLRFNENERLYKISSLLPNYYNVQELPSTPEKCKGRCRSSPIKYNNYLKSSPLRTIDLNAPQSAPKRSVRKLEFIAHSLSCEQTELISTKVNIQQKPLPFQFKPGQRIDIVRFLGKSPPMLKIFSYLSNENVYNFSLVSKAWWQLCENVSEAKQKKQQYIQNFLLEKENQNNKIKNIYNCTNSVNKTLRTITEIQNTMNFKIIHSTPVSPPGTPRSLRFKKFTKSASLDTRVQLACVRCRQPAKITEEPSGEEWGECSSSTCSFQFCRFCMCDRHPTKLCFKYDLDGPSPSKKKKSLSTAGTEKSKKKLRRLIMF